MQQINFEEIDYEKILNCNKEHFVVEKESELFHFKLHLKNNSKKLVVFSNGAYDLSKNTPPVFMRASWVEEMNYNALFIDDKTVHNNGLRIGWGVGTKDRHFLIDYSQIVKKVTKELNIIDKDIYYFGSSQGGFMSMALSAMHEGTTAIVNNPQTYVDNYHERAVNALYNTIFPEKSRKDILIEYADRISITTIFRKYRTPRTFYYQNRLCTSDMRNHLSPFLRRLDRYNIDSSNINFILYNNKKDGHNPINKEKTLKLIDEIIYDRATFIK